jgi:hypothetical protein
MFRDESSEITLPLQDHIRFEVQVGTTTGCRFQSTILGVSCLKHELFDPFTMISD